MSLMINQVSIGGSQDRKLSFWIAARDEAKTIMLVEIHIEIIENLRLLSGDTITVATIYGRFNIQSQPISRVLRPSSNKR